MKKSMFIPWGIKMAKANSAKSPVRSVAVSKYRPNVLRMLVSHERLAKVKPNISSPISSQPPMQHQKRSAKMIAESRNFFYQVHIIASFY
jgi:hypothetical protein